MYIYGYIWVYMGICMCICVYAYMYIRKCVYVYTCIRAQWLRASIFRQICMSTFEWRGFESRWCLSVGI